MTLLDLATRLRLTQRVLLSPVVARQLLFVSSPRAYVHSGVLFGRWPTGSTVLALEAASAGGDLDWRRQEEDQPHPFTVETAYIHGWHDALNAQPGKMVRPCGVLGGAAPRVLALARG